MFHDDACSDYSVLLSTSWSKVVEADIDGKRTPVDCISSTVNWNRHTEAFAAAVQLRE
jgi:hypothetical protein